MHRKLTSIMGSLLGSYWVVIIFTLHLSGLIFMPVHGAQLEAELEPAINAVVMLTGTLNDAPSLGAGIIFGQGEDRLYIATANHVVRRGKHKINNLKVRLKAYPDLLLDAVLLDKHRSNLDLAFLEVGGLSAKGVDVTAIDWHILARSDALNSGSGVFPVGNPDNRPWGRPAAPAPGFEQQGDRITFESILTRSGHSGGGLIDESGVLIGMVLGASPTHGQARDIQVIIDALEKLGYQISLKLAHVYQIAGKWEGNSLFPHIHIQVDGTRITGEIDVSYPGRYKPMTSVYREGRTVTTITQFFNETVEFVGKIRGNSLLLDVRGSWTKSEQTTQSSQMLIPVYTYIDFMVHLKGHAQQDDIAFSYKFEYPAISEQQAGRFTATRVRTSERKNWQLILKEVLETEIEATP